MDLAMMNDQIPTLLLPALKLTRQHRGRQKLLLTICLLVITGLILFLLVAAWEARGNPPAAPHAHKTAPGTSSNLHKQQPTPSSQATPTTQTALIAPQVD